MSPSDTPPLPLPLPHFDLSSFRKAQAAVSARQREEAGVVTTSGSFSAGLARSMALLLGTYFKRPSRLFRPSRVDTLAGLKQIAQESHQSLSPAFIRRFLRERGPKAMFLSILPPLAINTCLGTLLFGSHALFCQLLSQTRFFAPTPLPSRSPSSPDRSAIWTVSSDGRAPKAGVVVEEVSTWLSLATEEHFVNLERMHRLPHPTMMAAVAGMGSGVVQAVFYAPIENAVKLVQRSTVSWLDAFRAVFRIPKPPTSAISAPSGPSLTDVRSFLGLPTLSAWRGFKWVVARDSVAYGIFFAAFDVSRRTGLRVKDLLRGPGEREGKARTRARLGQAGVLVVGGISASLLADFASRPFRRVEELFRRAESRPPGVEFASHPTAGALRPTRTRAGWSFVAQEARAHGVASFFHPPGYERIQADRGLAWGARVKSGMGRLGWRLIGVVPSGLGFLVFAVMGGEV